jgi:hypothetical protein
VSDLLLILAVGKRLQEVGDDRGIESVEGIVPGEQDAIDACEVQRMAEQTRSQHAAGRDVDVGLEVLGDAPFEVGGDVGEAVDPVEREQEHLAPVPQDDLRLRVAVEGAAHDEAKRRESRLDMPSPAEGGRREVGGRVKPAVGRLSDRVRGSLGMDEDRPAQAGSSREQIVVDGVIQRAFAAATVGHDPNVSGRFRGPLKLGHRCVRV